MAGHCRGAPSFPNPYLQEAVASWDLHNHPGRRQQDFRSLALWELVGHPSLQMGCPQHHPIVGPHRPMLGHAPRRVLDPMLDPALGR